MAGLRCDHCNSEQHLWRKCDAPGGDDYRRRRAASGGKGYTTTEASQPADANAGGAQPASSFTSALQHWQHLTGQPTAPATTRHFFVAPIREEVKTAQSEGEEQEYEDDYCPDVTGGLAPVRVACSARPTS